MRVLLLGLILFNSMAALAASGDILFLNKSLDFLDENGRSIKLSPKKNLTLFKIINVKGSVTEVELIQENGNSKSKKLFVSSKWLHRGTKAHTLITDPTVVMAEVNRTLSGDIECDEEPEKIQSVTPSKSCKALNESISKSSANSLVDCMDSLLSKIPKSGSATHRLSALYDFSEVEQEFLAHVLTAFGEARGAKPTKAQLKGVMNVIQNRVDYAQRTHPDANALDIVFQKSQFSMYNPSDNNWKEALKNSEPKIMKIAIEAFIEMKTEKPDIPSNVYHYMTTSLSKRGIVSWGKSSKKTRVQVDGNYLDNSGGHVYYKNVAWKFNPNNRYNK